MNKVVRIIDTFKAMYSFTKVKETKKQLRVLMERFSMNQSNGWGDRNSDTLNMQPNSHLDGVNRFDDDQNPGLRTGLVSHHGFVSEPNSHLDVDGKFDDDQNPGLRTGSVSYSNYSSVIDTLNHHLDGSGLFDDDPNPGCRSLCWSC